jgi:hypothetical protein
MVFKLYFQSAVFNYSLNYFNNIRLGRNFNAFSSVNVNAFRGNNVLGYIIAWARHYSVDKDLDRIRIDTGSGNDRLINYYIRNGFTYIGDTGVDYTPDLPLHYKNGRFALLEMPAK